MIRVLAFVPPPSAGRPAGAVGSSRGCRFCVGKGVGVTLSPFFSGRGMDVLYIFRAAEVWGLVSADVSFLNREAALQRMKGVA